MLRTIYLKNQIAFAEKANRVIFTLRKLKWMGNLISEEWYVRSDIKKVLGILGALLSVLWDIVMKGVYFFCLILLPALGISELTQIPRETVVPFLFFILNCLMGSLTNSSIFAATDSSEYLMLNLMRVNPKEHYMTKFAVTHGKQLIYYAAFLGITLMGLENWSVAMWLGFMLIYACFRFIGEAVRLKLNDRFGIPFQEKSKTAAIIYYIYNILMVLVAYCYYPLTAALLPELGREAPGILHIERILFSFPVVLLIAFVAAFAIRYLFYYKKYTMVARRVTNQQSLHEMENAVEKAKKSAYEVEEKDVEESELHSHLFQDKEGYEYMNALFFRRHKKLVRDAVRIKVVVIGFAFATLAIILLCAVFLLETSKYLELCDTLWDSLNRFITIFIFIMYCASSGQNLTQAMFYNCDVSLLKYGYYRTSGAVLLNFRIRLRYMIKAELPTMGVLCLGLFINTLLIGQWHNWLQLLSIMLCVCSLSIFYSVVFLCMYYIFQPFTEGGAKTGVGYSICSGIIYFVSYACLQIQTVPQFFSGLVLAVTIVGVVVSFIIAYLVAPKTFQLK